MNSYAELRQHLARELSKVTEYAENEAKIIISELSGMSAGEATISDAVPTEKELERARTILELRLKRKPLQYILKKAWFRHLELYVDEGVLIPRPETEIMVDWLLEETRRQFDLKQRAVRLLDIGTGSGAIAAALADELLGSGVDFEIDAFDISDKAIAIAEKNTAKFERVNIFKSDLFEVCSGSNGAGGGRAPMCTYDIIYSNPPYIAESERAGLSLEVLSEPEEALFAGDGLDFYRWMMPQLFEHLEQRGAFILELGATQFDAVKKMAMECGSGEAWAIEDYAGRRRFICWKN